MITIVSSYSDSESGAWICWLELSQDEETWWLPATAPGDVLEGELQAHFEARWDGLWRLAQEKQHAPDIVQRLAERELLVRLVKVILSEVNILREAAGLEPRTLAQLKRALRDAK